ncbi:MAG: cache domain-containing protein [Candidatus Aminicenantaceae bacterium]
MISKFLNLPLRRKLILSFLMVISMGGILTLILGTRLEHRTITGLAQAKVRHDLASAWMVYNEKLNDIRDIIAANASRESLQQLIQSEDFKTLSAYLRRVRAEFDLDILTLTDSQGKVIVRASQPATTGDDQSWDPLVSLAIRGNVVSATQIISQIELLREGDALAEQAFLKIIPTPKAAPSTQDSVTDGMMLKAAAPLYDENRAIIGSLYGGILLNRNYTIVDRIKELVFKGEKYNGTEIGTATIFQHDLRISTNVQRDHGERAIGTRISQEVSQAVLKQGRTWTDRAFVVNDWYLTAYEPIKNIDKEIIGILYVGMLEKPYIDLRNRVMAIFTGMAILCVVILLILLFFITSTFIRPLQVMVEATGTIARGDLNHQVEVTYQDEVGQLAQAFNQMTMELNKANAKLLQWGKTLEKRVDERTRELVTMQNSLIQSEKLASLGKMAAGVAHEINNPLTSILISAHLLMEKADKKSDTYESLDMIAEETTRCSQIVKGLLEFSRQSPPQKNLVNINDILIHIVNILKNQAVFQNIKIQKNLGPDLPDVEVDPDKMKQVFWNLMSNAAEAMPEGGTLIVASRLSGSRHRLEISFTDTGTGIPEELLPKLFDPFFTTKKGGTGLGLAVIYGIAKQHGGSIEVKSQPGQGSIFTVSLPLSQSHESERGGSHVSS